MPSTEEILKKYGNKIEKQMSQTPKSTSKDFSREYVKFKQEMLPEVTRYKSWAETLGNIIKIKVPEKDKKIVEEDLKIAHVDVSPSQAMTLAVVSMLLIFLGMI